ncbi:hypothetical protein A9Q76_04495 [Arcobacter sp. 31_11_sub10_T18]|nr:hypothetical protein A9Q76_04495 [Arcobacter sp. 31_11_sub10_T18]
MINNLSRLSKLLLSTLLITTSLIAEKQNYISINDESKYKDNYTHFDYVNPSAPKGGTLKLSARGTYDSLNAFVLKGTSASGLGLLFDTLMSASQDEPSVSYPLVAEFIEVSPSNDWVKFYINKNAKFQNGNKISAEDVKFSFETLITKGTPFYKRYYFDVKDVEVLDNLTVKFNFKKDDNKELAYILSQIPIFSKEFWKDKNFAKSDALVPMGSGPYTVDTYKFGKFITYKRNVNYWAKDLLVNVGQYNFGKIKYDYYKDESVTLEAFKAGEFDLRMEYTAKTWATLYTGKNFDNGNIIKKAIPHELAQGMQGFVFNLRKPLFQDREVRRALNLAFDFEWTNKKLFYNQYKRLNSYFANCELSSQNLPSNDELKLLTPFKEQLPKSLFTTVFQNNVTKGDGKIRKELRAALKILKKQGWKFKNKVLEKDGKKFEFEILITSPAFERIVQPFIKNLKKIGVIAKLKMLESVSYRNKLNSFEFDMMVQSLPVSLSPGNELNNYWGSKAANIKGSSNYMGLKSPVVDALIQKVVTSPNRASLITSVRALDRVLLNNYYVIPQWYIPSNRIAYWKKLKQPKTSPKYGLGIFTWWINDESQK